MNSRRMNRLLLRSVFLAFSAIAALPQDDPLAVNRPNPTYESVLTKQPLPRLVTSYHLNFYEGQRRPPALRPSRSPTRCRKRRSRRSPIIYRAGMDGPFVPRFIDRFGETTLNEWANKGMKFPYFPPYGSYTAAAKQAGAIFFFPLPMAAARGEWPAGTPA